MDNFKHSLGIFGQKVSILEDLIYPVAHTHMFLYTQVYIRIDKICKQYWTILKCWGGIRYFPLACCWFKPVIFTNQYCLTNPCSIITSTDPGEVIWFRSGFPGFGPQYMSVRKGQKLPTALVKIDLSNKLLILSSTKN